MNQKNQKIVIKENRIIITINNKFYNTDLVKQAVSEFNKVLPTKFYEDSQEVVFECTENGKKAAFEFYNYCLALTKT